MKSIYETLAALGAGALLVSACGGSTPAPASPDVPAAMETTPAAASANESGMGDAAASDMTGNEAAAPADGSTPAAAAVAATTTPSATPTAAPTAAAKAPVKAAAKKTGTKKKDAAGSCGEGTCG